MPLIENLQITNFKCFKQLDVKGLGQVNLIGGKNNMGKTAFLEAVELFLSSKSAEDLVFRLHCLLEKRQHEINYFELDFFCNDFKQINISCDSDKYCRITWALTKDIINDTEEKADLDVDKLLISISDKSYKSNRFVPVNEFIAPKSFNRDISKGFWYLENGQKLSYISAAKSKELDIAILLSELINLDREDFLNQSLELFDSNITKIRQLTTPNGVVLKLKLKNQENLVLLSSLGEGINRYIAILCAIWANKDGFLLIDEIENGIHFTNYPKLWEIIFKTSVEANCQLFITSHSKECITAFNDMQFEVENCDAQYFELYRNQKTDLITSFARDKDQLRYALTHEGKVRGE